MGQSDTFPNNWFFMDMFKKQTVVQTILAFKDILSLRSELLKKNIDVTLLFTYFDSIRERSFFGLTSSVWGYQ